MTGEGQSQEGLQSGPQQEKSSFRMRRVFEVSRFDIKKPTVEGIENLPPIPCVVATTHLSDVDVQEVAMVVANIRKIGIVSQETNLTYAPFVPFVKAIGRENFFPITNSYDNGHARYSLKIEDLERMEKGVREQRRTMIVAGHNPTHDWQLARNPGLAAVILAHMANVPLVPATLDIDSKTPVAQSTDVLPRIKNFVTLKRPAAKIIFGESMNLVEIPEEKLRAAIEIHDHDKRNAMTAEQITEARETLEVLKRESEQMMEAFASKLPPEKRGRWGTKEDSKA